VIVSLLGLRDRALIAGVESKVGVEARAVGRDLEITENPIMEDEDVTNCIATLPATRAFDETVAIDDFGTGLSTLSHPATLPGNTRTIDRSFVNDTTAGPRGAPASTIVNLAHLLNLSVVAESGLETEEQSRRPGLPGCDEMQGYLFPVPAETFEARFLARASADQVLQHLP
jgi:EAL domain-containing protein (putative c-di-GMP-specific phosphodiesterase class I)